MQGSKWRWLMAGSFTAAASGRKVAVSGERFASVMANVGVDAPVTLPLTLGDAVSGPVPLQFERPRKFRVDDVISAIEPLQRLEALARVLTRDKDLAPEVIAARVEKIVGGGGLATRFEPQAPENDEKPEPPEPEEREAAPAVSPPAPAPISASVDDIFSKAELPGADDRPSAKSGLDAFVNALRGPQAQGPLPDPAVSLDAAKTVREAIAQAAISILGQPAIARLESSWRGLKMVVSAAPGHDHLGIDLLDVDPDGIVEALERTVHADDPQRPNAIFVGIALPPSTLERVARFAERLQIPVVVGVSKTLTGPAWRDEDPHVAPDWTALREQSAADWLCGAANPVVLAHEETAVGPRVVLGSAAWGVASILASNIARTGDLRSTMGPAGAVVAPAAHEIDIGYPEPRTIPTREYANVDALQRADRHGVMLLGSAPGSDQFLIASNTMVGKGGLTQRISRSARMLG